MSITFFFFFHSFPLPAFICYYVSIMKTEIKYSLFFLVPFFFILLLISSILIGRKLYPYGVRILFPIPFLFPIWMTFAKGISYGGTRKSVFFLLLMLRYFLVAMAIILPALCFAYIPWFSSRLKGFSLLIPPAEVLTLYRLLIPETLWAEKKRKKK